MLLRTMPKPLELIILGLMVETEGWRYWAVAATSFFPSKNLGCYGDGGAIFTNDDDLAHTLRGVVNHGMYVRYHHDVVGVNSRLDSLQAVVLRQNYLY